MESCHSSPHGRCYMVGIILDFTSYELRFKNRLSPEVATLGKTRHMRR